MERSTIGMKNNFYFPIFRDHMTYPVHLKILTIWNIIVSHVKIK